MNTINRIIFNTISQYLRIILAAVLMLYATRIVLNELGEVDFGLYSLLGSVVVFLSFIATALSRSTQRFISYNIGLNDIIILRKVLYNSILLHIVASLIICVIIFASEGLLFKYVFDIQPDKIGQAKILYNLLIVGVFVTMNTSPFLATFISHEDIMFTSILQVGTYVLRLAGAFSLSLFDLQNRLIVYAVIMIAIPAAEMVVYILVSKYRYEECRDFFHADNFDKNMVLEFLSFSGWNMYGTLCIMTRQQGYAMALNHFFGLLYNSGYGISTQISTQINSMVYALSNAVSPIITKSEGGRNRKKMIYGSIESSKISFIFFIIIVIPFVFTGKPILDFWLGEVPPATFLFSCTILLTSMADSFASGLRTGIFAIGAIKEISLKVYTIKFLSILFSIIVFKLRGSLFISLVPFVLFEVIGVILTIDIFCRLTAQSRVEIIRKTFLKTAFPLITSVFVCVLIKMIFVEKSIAIAIFAYLITFLSVSFVAYFHSLDTKERNALGQLLRKMKK